MEVTVNNGVDDLYALNEHIARNLPTIRRQILIVWLGIPILFVLLGLVLAQLSGDISSAYTYFAAAFLFLPFYPVFIKWCRRRNVRMLLQSGRNLGIFGQQKIVLSPTEIARFSKYGHAAYYWPAVERIEVAANHAFVFVSSVNAFLIPKKDFPNEYDFDLFVETARKYHRQAEADLD